MKLFEEIPPEVYNDDLVSNEVKPREHHRAKFEDILIKEPSEQQLSSIAQFFLAPFILDDSASNGVLHISVGENFIYNTIVDEIAPHFGKVRKVTCGNEVQFILENIKESSKKEFLFLFSNNKINAIVHELYANDKMSHDENYSTKQYKVNLEAVTQSLEHDIITMWNFFKHSLVQTTGFLVLFPKEWEFNESFKDRITIQAFASVCNSMRIAVNAEKNKIAFILIR